MADTQHQLKLNTAHTCLLWFLSRRGSSAASKPPQGWRVSCTTALVPWQAMVWGLGEGREAMSHPGCQRGAAVELGATALVQGPGPSVQRLSGTAGAYTGDEGNTWSPDTVRTGNKENLVTSLGLALNFSSTSDQTQPKPTAPATLQFLLLICQMASGSPK